MYKNFLNFKGQNTIIFGSSGILGKEIIKCFKAYGSKLIEIDIIKKNKNCIKCDASSEKELNDLKKKIPKKINNVIISITAKDKNFYKTFENTSTSTSSLNLLLNAEIKSAYLISKIFYKYLKKTRGNLIFVSSIYGVIGNDPSIYKGSNLSKIYAKSSIKNIYPNPSYNIVKGGLISLTKYLAAKWGEKGIRVNCVSPGGIYNKKENKVFLRNYSRGVPLGRKAKPQEVASTILFLSSKGASYITGQNIIVDGGKSII